MVWEYAQHIKANVLASTATDRVRPGRLRTWLSGKASRRPRNREKAYIGSSEVDLSVFYIIPKPSTSLPSRQEDFSSKQEFQPLNEY